MYILWITPIFGGVLVPHLFSSMCYQTLFEDRDQTTTRFLGIERYRKQKGQSWMDNPETLATLSTQDIVKKCVDYIRGCIWTIY
jgi:hypothetical protein